MRAYIFLALILSSITAIAGVLPATQKSLRFEYSMGSAKDLYAGSNKVSIKDATGNSKREISNVGFLGSFGLGDRAQVDLGLTYSSVDVGNDVKQGGVSEILARLIFDIVDSSVFEFDLGLGFRAAGDNRGGDSFLALSDGLTKYDFYLGLGWNPGPIQVALNTRYTDRSHPVSKSQLSNELSLIATPLDQLQIALGYQMFSTNGGFDIGGAGFTGNFSQVKEEYTALNLSAGYQVATSLIVDGRYGQKLSGKNTDGNTTVGVGVTTLF